MSSERAVHMATRMTWSDPGRGAMTRADGELWCTLCDALDALIAHRPAASDAEILREMADTADAVADAAGPGYGTDGARWMAHAARRVAGG